jgi:hypothetical protein
MSEEGEEPFLDCYLCSGENGRERRSQGSPICKFDGCVKEHARRRAAAKESGLQRTALAPAAAAVKRTSCFKIREVVGVDLCVAADGRQKRAGRPLDADNMAYKVRGGYGEDKDDELIPDTRWVNLSELVANLDDRSLVVLDSWANGLQKVLKAARKKQRALRNEREADDDA